MLQLLMLGAWGVGSPLEIADVLSAAQRAHDRLVLEVSHEYYTCPLDADPLDRDVWEPIASDGQHYAVLHRVSICAPSVLVDTTRGEVLTRQFLASDGTVVTQDDVTSELGGPRVYSIMPLGIVSFKEGELLHALGLHISGSELPFLNFGRVLTTAPCAERQSPAGSALFTAQVGMQAWDHDYEFEVSWSGYVVRSSTLQKTRSGFRTEFQSFTTKTSEVRGYPFPVEVVTAAYPLNYAGATHQVIQRFEITAIELHPELTPDDLVLVPERRNSIVVTQNPGNWVQTVYDEDGNIIDPEIQTERRSDRQVPPMRRAESNASLGWGLLAGACAVAFVLTFFRTRR
jgi:hypothetical protein